MTSSTLQLPPRPSAASQIVRTAPPAGRHALQLAIREEADRAAVGRPERAHAPRPSREAAAPRSRPSGGPRPGAFRLAAGRGEGERRALGRKGERAPAIEIHLGRQLDRRARDGGVRRAASSAPATKRERARRRGRDRDGPTAPAALWRSRRRERGRRPASRPPRSTSARSSRSAAFCQRSSGILREARLDDAVERRRRHRRDRRDRARAPPS